VSIDPGGTVPGERSQRSLATLADRWAPLLVLSPSVLISLIFVYGFMLTTGYLSLTASTLMPRYTIDGLGRYRDLFANTLWWDSVWNLFWFTAPFILFSIVLGLLLAILMDQKIRFEGGLRAIFLYPLALSQIVAGTAWQWLLNPSLGIEKSMRDLGWESFSFNGLGNPKLAIFCVALAAVWQCTGFVAALFLAGLRSVDDEVVKAGQIDGAGISTIYRRIILPMIRPVFFSAFLILGHLAIKTFDLIVAMTAGGPGTSTWLPSIFVYNFAFERGRMGIGAAAAMMMLAMVVAVILPLMYMESRATKNVQ
jgi:glucose/mannose transport system permease protein